MAGFMGFHSYSLTNHQKALLLLAFFILIIIIICAVLQRVFGTFYLPRIIRQYKANQLLGQKYESMFRTREQVVYHISWAKARGDFDEAAKLCKDLVKLDEVSLQCLMGPWNTYIVYVF
jgi:cbb3-type cytochrome oxidase subunit 3